MAKPLLSICIPTFNRASFLKVMLQALLPQAAEAGDEVEVVVLDNASTDDTPAVIEAARGLGPLRSCGHDNSIGPIANVVKGPAELAAGEFVWVLGDHNLMRPDALGRVLSALRANRHLEIFYVNFRCGTYPDHWPTAAVGGFDGPFSYLPESGIETGPVDHWFELILAKSAMCTQLYAHIVRTTIWRNFWTGRQIPAPYTSALTTYPHTWMIASELFDSPAMCLADPALTIFNGAQSWGDPATVAKVYFTGFPDLLRLFRSKGFSKAKLAEGREFCCQQLQKVTQRMLSRPSAGVISVAGLLARAGFTRAWMWPAIWRDFLDAQNCWLSRMLRMCRGTLTRWHRYWFHNCRPARWIRNRRLRGRLEH